MGVDSVAAVQDAAIETEQWRRTRDKFMRLLTVERPSVQFDRLYAEVDELLTRLMQEERDASRPETAAHRSGKTACR